METAPAPQRVAGLRGAAAAPADTSAATPAAVGVGAAPASPPPARPPAPAGGADVQRFLGTGVWRAGTCGREGNFQAFRFGPLPQVEVGLGQPGSGELLEMIAASRRADMVEVRTRVCAPVGCNQTYELYRVLGPDRLQEWRFEGRLPDRPPNIVVADGRASDGSAGRIFTRCPA